MRTLGAVGFFHTLCTKTDQYNDTREEEQREFVMSYLKAFQGEYTPQRNLGFMLYTGSSGAIRKKAIQDCAWRGAIFQTGQPQMDTGDTGNGALACERLSASDRTAPAARIVAIMGETAVARDRK